MDIQIVMNMLSQCRLGAMLMTKEYYIKLINETGKQLLFPDGFPTDGILPEQFRELCRETKPSPYIMVSFMHYIKIHPAPRVDLPKNSRLIVFRDATNEYRLDILHSICGHLSASIVACDSESRLSYINDPAMKMDMVIEDDIMGENTNKIYQMTDAQAELPLPKTLRTKSPILNYRQHYVTRYGKEVNAMASTWPIIKNGQLLGAFNILEDWSSVNELHKQVADLQNKLRNQETKHSAKSTFTTRYSFDDIIYVSDTMKDIIAQCKQVAKADSAVMIYGETGTGKELFAQSIHQASRRSEGPFLAINCAALPENLLESLLFGSVKGAYTGAESRTGLFEQANHGTLLLDEINSMHISLQAKLLRVLQEGTIRKLGGSKEIKIDVRVLSCINIPPQQAIDEGKLRQDLFYRLGVVNITIPPLRRRKKDIPYLVKHFIREYNHKLLTDVAGVNPSVLDLFCRYRWPGNVRELQHAIEHSMNILPDGVSIITPKYLPQTLLEEDLSANMESSPDEITAEIHRRKLSPEEEKVEPSLGHALKDMEKDRILFALEANNGNITHAAHDLKISRQNLQYRIKRYGIDVSQYRRK